MRNAMHSVKSPETTKSYKSEAERFTIWKNESRLTTFLLLNLGTSTSHTAQPDPPWLRIRTSPCVQPGSTIWCYNYAQCLRNLRVVTTLTHSRQPIICSAARVAQSTFKLAWADVSSMLPFVPQDRVLQRQKCVLGSVCYFGYIGSLCFEKWKALFQV